MAAVSAAAIAAPKKCRAYREDFGKQKDEADAFNESALAAALAQRKLKLLDLPVDDLLNQRGGPLGLVQRDGESYFIAGDVESGNQPMPDLTFVEDAAHAVYIVDRDPELVSATRYFVCGCGPPHGGGAYQPRTIAYRLPKDRPFKGHLRIRVREKRVVITWRDLGPDGAPCAQPP